MQAGDHVHPVENDKVAREAERWRRRLERERAARHEAEEISERVTRELYDKQQELILAETIAKAANEATDVELAMRVSLEAVRSHRNWRLGHVWLLDDAGDLVSTDIWAGDLERDAAFREATLGLVFPAGTGLPGRVLVERQAVWLCGREELDRLPRGPALAAAGLFTAMCFPVLIANEVGGVLEFFSEQELAPDDELLSLMWQIGIQLGRVVERRRAAEELLHQATHDALTGLPNRLLILDELRRALARQARRDGERTAVFFVDLDGFKAINDSLGHAAGDRVLRHVAERLHSSIRPGDTLGRLSGDEFVIVCEALASEHAAAYIAERLAEALREPFSLHGEQFIVTASVGIALAEDRDDPAQLIERADAAMYRSKELGKARYEVFSEELRARIGRRLELERALRHALRLGELRLYYQPLFDVRSNAIVGVEALLRWQRGDDLILPADFIGIAEETGLIVPIGGWVVDEALRQLAAWQADPAIADVPWMSVNLSVRQLTDPGLLDTVSGAIETSGADPSRLYLEVTESVILDDAETGLSVLTDLRKLGTEIAIDDFGTGYASLSYLRRFPASVVKVDGSFIEPLADDARTRSIVEAIVHMGRALDLAVVAEGIETEGQLDAVRVLGFDLGQGFLFAAPAPPEQTAALLRAS